ncbi:MAG: hypothetical protein DWH79_00230 [Planctomycetota bacterium]|nr:MAG: hypothetical protein DWH79_00230 [Planctomycetota bacterium]
MNKAFCKEPEQSARPLCPRCGAEGQAVGAATLRAHLAAADAESLAEPAAWCDSENCPVAYFDGLERIVEVSRATGIHWPKDPTGVLCNCHGLTCEDVDADLAEGEPTRVREVVRRAAEPGAKCILKSADGRSCVARVQRFYLRRRAAAGG